jgi:Amt family ammonium transporter
MGKYNKYVPFILFAIIAITGAVLNFNYSHVKGGPVNSGDTAWMLTATGLVLLMTPGLAFFYGGMVGQKNIISTMLQSFIAMGAISIIWVVVGFSLAFGDSIGGIVGNPFTYFMFRGVNGETDPALAPTFPLLLFAMFQLKFAIITPALITGSFAERIRFSAYLLFIVLFSLVIYAPLAHMTWHPDGFLRKLGVLDFAGGTVVHMSAGFAALAGALHLGRRHAHIAKERHIPANIPYVILGTGLLWFGWFGFNAGSAMAANGLAALAFATTNTASASAAIAWIFFDVLMGRKPSAMSACIGAVVGLVAITPAAGYVSVGASIFIGATAACVSNIAVAWKGKTTLDDALDVFPCHGLGGIVGMIFTGIFAKDVGLINGVTATFLAHMLALVIVGVFTFGGSYLLYIITDKLIPMRVSKEEEIEGLDISQHGESIRARMPSWDL